MTGFAFRRLLDDLEARGDAVAVVEVAGEELRTHRYATIARDARRLARGLVRDGLRPGDPVGLMAPNGVRWIVVRLAIAAAGGVAVAIDDQASAEEAAVIVRSGRPGRIVCTRQHLPMLRRLRGDAAFEIAVVDDDGLGDDDAPGWRRLFSDAAEALPDLADDAPAMRVYTSGTTGTPKAFLLSYGNIEVNVRAMAGFGLVGASDRMLLPLPMHHVYPLVVGVLVPFSVGAAIVLPEAATGQQVVRALSAADATVMIGVPRLYEAMVAGLRAQAQAKGPLTARAFSVLLEAAVAARKRTGRSIGRTVFPQVHDRLGRNLKLFVSAGAKLSGEVIWILEGLGFRTLSGYGLAETASAFTGNVPTAQRIGSEGRPLVAGSEIRIAEPNAEGYGEIQLRGPSVFAGYLDNPEANAAAFTADGWFRTGDLGCVDSDGFVFVTGRLKEMIVLGGGKNVFPEDLEAHYGASPLVAEIAVLERAGALVALVRPDLDAIRRSGAAVVDDAVRVALAEAARSLPSHQRLTGFAIVREPMPRTRLGKYQRFALPALYDQARSGVRRAAAPPSDEDRALLAHPTASAAWRILQARFADCGLSLDAHPQLDLGIDSLGWLELGMELEATLGVALAEEEMAEVASIRDLLRLLETKAAEPSASAPAGRAAQVVARDAETWLAPVGPGTRAAGAALWGVNRALARTLFRLRTEGLELLPSAPPFVVAANHTSDLDPVLIAASLPLARMRRVYWSGDRERLFDTGWRRAFCRAVQIFPVDERAPGATLAMAGRVLARGDALVWFPESWRSPDGTLQRFLPGIGHLLVEHSVPVVPAVIRGAFEALPRHRRWPRPHPVRVTFGAPRTPAELEAAGAGETRPARIADGLRRAVAALAGESAER